VQLASNTSTLSPKPRALEGHPVARNPRWGGKELGSWPGLPPVEHVLGRTFLDLRRGNESVEMVMETKVRSQLTHLSIYNGPNHENSMKRGLIRCCNHLRPPVAVFRPGTVTTMEMSIPINALCITRLGVSNTPTWRK